MKIATWNVNSIKARMHAVTAWLETANPDVACLQEIKTVDDSFPRLEIEALGYNIVTHGQKSYNGVAVLSKLPFEDVNPRLPGDESDEQARYLEVVVSAKTGPVRIASIYLPNGNPVREDPLKSPKYTYKLDWMARLKTHAEALLKNEEPLILAGDYNVIPRSVDTHDPKGWWGDALFRQETLDAFHALKYIGLTEMFEQFDNRGGEFTFWDYQGGAWQNNLGIRIDHLLLSPQAADRAKGIEIHKHVREGQKPSDHVPVVGEFDL
ncbi:exodeoxyribonuclease III [Litorimonas taeanensis]|uniref:Exodeoxyribonuclease III n=1 Tax=Litorimonas taeanensis TaxID=568099 RepID=A0A420WL75_9PROT|nr:exodeoxyribonuclease III [Litorimonas taeanensis]RKQ71740.1 exodeoxyribonuclease III [Litorimonas taeanensis]